MTSHEYVYELCRKAKAASSTLAIAGESIKNEALRLFAEKLINNSDAILCANAKDIARAKDGGMSESMLDRLSLTKERIKAIASAVSELILLPDPCGTGEVFTRPNGLEIKRVRVPLGVIGVIFEARPNVSADVAALCIKSGNCAVLRGGREAFESNNAIITCAREALSEVGLSADSVALLSDTGREAANELMKMRGGIDLLIPRGGKGLIRSVVENATVPVIETGAGNCHVYVDKSAQLDKAIKIIVNAKTQRPSVCNAAEGVIVHKEIAESFLPMLRDALAPYHVELRGCSRACAICPSFVAATPEDFDTEYDDLIAHVKVVDSLDEAICEINTHGTHHSDAIITEELAAAERFTRAVDSAAVYVNASTRFTDGGEFGFGAEIGISTQKLHARGPMGLTALTCDKYIIVGDGQTR